MDYVVNSNVYFFLIHSRYCGGWWNAFEARKTSAKRS